MEIIGTVKAFTFLHLPTLGGESRSRRVSMGTVHGVDIEDAKNMVDALREQAASAPHRMDYVAAQFTANL